MKSMDRELLIAYRDRWRVVDDLPDLIEVAKEEALLSRIDDAKAFAPHNGVLLLRHRPSETNVDVSLGMLSFEVEAVERSILYPVGPISVRLPTPKDLIILKAVARRYILATTAAAVIGT